MLPVGVKKTLDALAGVLDLGPDWDSYGGRDVDPRSVQAAMDLARSAFSEETPPPSVVPTSKGGVQLEWHTVGVDLEVEFVPPAQVLGLFEDGITGEAWEKDLTLDRDPVFRAISLLSRRGKASGARRTTA